MKNLKKAFQILLVLDFIGLILEGLSMATMFKMPDEYGKLMFIVTSVIAAVFAAVRLFEIGAKIFLIRSTSSTFSWESGRKGYIAAAKLLLLCNLGGLILNVLSLGGEGATLINQGRMYIQILADVIEMITVFIYLLIVKDKLKKI